MDIKKTIKNWRWWVMMLVWCPIAAPFAIIQILLSVSGSALMLMGQQLRDFSDWQFSNALSVVFKTKAVTKWVYRSDT